MSMPSELATTTMPSRLYVDPAVYEWDKERVFYRTWQFVGHVCNVATPGAYFTAQIADESLVIVRDESGELRAFYNVCRHRAHRVVTGRGVHQREEKVAEVAAMGETYRETNGAEDAVIADPNSATPCCAPGKGCTARKKRFTSWHSS